MVNSNNSPLFSKGDSGSHPLVDAAHSQGSGLNSHITSGANIGSGLIIGGSGGASTSIVGHGGTKPVTPVIGGGGGGANTPVVRQNFLQRFFK